MSATGAGKAPAGGSGKRADQGPVVKAYLVAYNVASILGWAYVIAQIVQYFARHSDLAGAFFNQTASDNLFNDIEGSLKLVQTAAILEVLHSMFGLVRAPFMTTAIQVASRLAVLWGISNISPPSRVHWSFPLMAISWSSVEIPRYLFYVWQLLVTPVAGPDGGEPSKDAATPAWLMFLRYSLFIVLYPTGITGELGQLLTSMPYVQEHRVWDVRLPNPHNLMFNYPLIQYLLLALYVPGSYIMYTHMLKQRKGKLGGGAKPKTS